jgi:hypothetical protein
MKKNALWMLTVILFCGANVLTSCFSNDNPIDKPVVDNLAEKIIGKWMMDEVDGKPVPTDSKQVLTYGPGNKFYYSLSINAISDLNVWVDHCEGSYTITGSNTCLQTVTVAGTNIMFKQQPTIIFINDDEMRLNANNETHIDGQPYRATSYPNERKIRVKHDYSTDVIGTWEGIRTSEQDVHSDGLPHRWEYKADGTFVYYRQNDNGEWVADVNTMSEYFVDGTLLCSRWKNVGNDKENRESWEIESIENDVMKWTALRQKADGTTYTATFSMKRVK